MTRAARSVVVLILLATGLVAAACSKSVPAKPTAPANVANPRKEADLTTITLTPEAERRLGIETVALEAAPIQAERTLGGEMLVPPGRSVPVTAPVAGRVDSVEGARLASGFGVRQQQVVLRLTPLSAPPRDLRVTNDADLAAAKARLDAAQTQLDRAKQMLKDQVGSQRGLEQAQQEFLSARASYEAARERLDRAGTRPLDADVSVPISAPFDGTVGQLLVAPGQVVPAGATLFELENLNTMWVRVPVYVGDMDALGGVGGAAVEPLGPQGGARRRPARRVTGPPSANAQATSADLFFEVANGDRAFRPGERVSVLLSSAGEAPGLAVPASAIAYDYHGGAWIYVKTAPGTYLRQRVEAARTVGANVVLARGAAAGSEVVTAGVAELFGTEFGAGK
jgi:RND family efflux transporter MFP subunit